MILSTRYYELLEEGKPLGWYLEPTEIWSYGEGCECGCKYVAASADATTHHHFKTLSQVAKFYRRERGELEPYRVELIKVQQAMYQQIELKFEQRWSKS
jgi:hypothetical protein